MVTSAEGQTHANCPQVSRVRGDKAGRLGKIRVFSGGKSLLGSPSPAPLCPVPAGWPAPSLPPSTPALLPPPQRPPCGAAARAHCQHSQASSPNIPHLLRLVVLLSTSLDLLCSQPFSSYAGLYSPPVSVPTPSPALRTSN